MTPEEEERLMFLTGGYGQHRRQWVNKKKPKIRIFQNFWRFWPHFRQVFQIYHKRTHLLENWVT